MKLYKRFFMSLFYSVFLIYLNTFMSFSQDMKTKKEPVPDSCESIAYKLDYIGNHFRKLENKKSKLIVIVTRAKGEKNKHAKKRLDKAAWYLGLGTRIERKQTVFGFDVYEKPSKLSYMRFFVDGEQLFEIKSIKRRQLCFGAGFE